MSIASLSLRSLLFVFVATGFAVAQTNLISVDVSAPVAAPETGYLHLGGVSATGHSLQVNSRYVSMDGKPVLPIMGEMHYARVPRAEWEPEILKMKAAGITIVATYIFWIHHEEVEGQFDWTGQRDLRAFVQLCAKHGMYVYLRPGPWAHGEVRNGGFPDWLMKVPKLRTTDAEYIGHVATLYNEIGKQVQGLMFRQDGPIVGAQLENEYGQHGAGRGAEYILKLKELAMAAGINPPLFSVTGWPSLDFPPHDVIPVSGGYPDGFWYTSKGNLAPSITYMFNFHRELGDMGANLKTENADGKVDLRHDPQVAAEQAGGMAIAYHRRPLMSADDIAATTVTGLGSGVNMYGYYMFHGGMNPTGKLSTLQESRATNYPNDLTQITYDFQAPLGEFGQVRESYRKTRMLHLFAKAYGARLAEMPAFAPSVVPKDPADNSVPRVAVRSDGAGGYVFVNNYVRQLAMPVRPGFQMAVKLAGGGSAMVPEKPIDVPAASYFVLPFNLMLEGAAGPKLVSATAQVLTHIVTPSGPLTVMFAIPGVAADLVFDAATVKGVAVGGMGRVLRDDGVWRVHVGAPGMQAMLTLTDGQGAKSMMLVLTGQQAEQVDVLDVGGKQYLAMTASDQYLDGSRLHLLSTASATQQVALMPALVASDDAAAKKAAAKVDGLWTTYTFTQPEKHLSLTTTMVHPAAARAEMDMETLAPGKKGPAFPLLPTDAEIAANGAEWMLKVPAIDMRGLAEVLLQVDYAGDIAHLSSGATLLDDNFYNGSAWQVGLKRFAPAVGSGPLRLDILPMPAGAPIYLDPLAKAAIAAGAGMKATLVPQYESVVTLTAR